MTKANLTTVLKAVENLVKRNRVAYRDFLGEETKTVKYCHGVIGTVEEIMENADGLLTDDGGGALVLGEVYHLTIDGVTKDVVATDMDGLTLVVDIVRGVMVCIAVGGIYKGAWAYTVISEEAVSQLAEKTISLTKTTTEKKYRTKLLPDYLLPSWLRKDKIATKAEAKNSLMAAADAMQRANAAYDKALVWTKDSRPNFLTSMTGGCLYADYTTSWPSVGIILRCGSPTNYSDTVTIRAVYQDTEKIDGCVLDLSGQHTYRLKSFDVPISVTGLSAITMKSPGGKFYKITVDDTGTLTTTEVTS